MGFTGKPSKGCLPCRQKRTKCDLALPACTQCVRKNRVCHGYRNEQDLVFKNETGLVVRRAKRRTEGQLEQSFIGEDFDLQYINAPFQQPSRRASLNDEAVLHFLSHYNEKFYSAKSPNPGGFDYLTPVLQSDTLRGGPVQEIVTACGLAGLGNMKNSPELRIAARAKQTKVLRQLNQQLQDRSTGLTNSSMLTCILLSTFENITSDGAQSMMAMQAHLRGAATLAEMRGREQFSNEIGHGLYIKMRGSILASCLRAREPIPEFILTFMDDDDIAQRDFDTHFFKLCIRLCRLRADHKIKGHVDEEMFKEVRRLMDDFDARKQDPVKKKRPSAEPAKQSTNADETYRVVWQATAWLFESSSRILISDLIVEWARGQYQAAPSSETSEALDNAIEDQLKLCEGLKDSVSYYLDHLGASKAATRIVGAHSLMWPLSVLTSISTTSPETYVWIAKQAQKVGEVFGLRQAKMLADYIWMSIRAAQKKA